MTTGLKIKAAFKTGQGDLKPKHPRWGEKEYFVQQNTAWKLSKTDKIELYLAWQKILKINIQYNLYNKRIQQVTWYRIKSVAFYQGVIQNNRLRWTVTYSSLLLVIPAQ